MTNQIFNVLLILYIMIFILYILSPEPIIVTNLLPHHRKKENVL